jgi:hypothetical protein
MCCSLRLSFTARTSFPVSHTIIMYNKANAESETMLKIQNAVLCNRP